MPRTLVDRGGTFTDVVTIDDEGQIHVRKVPSDRAVVGDLARGDLVFGTTVATNALLERTGAPTLLIVTEGFADLPQIGDMSRPELFDPEATWPVPLCTRVIEVRGRIGADGREVEPLTLPEAVDRTGIGAVAIALLNSHSNPAHEHQVAAWLARLAPGLHIALGHQSSPELGYLARIETTLADAALTPVLQAAMDRDRIPATARAMCSDGSLRKAPELRGADAVLSGPAGGVLAVAAVAKMAGFAAAVGLDMGGTSTDVCRVEVGRLPRREGDVRVAGIRLRRPMLEVDTIAAGGGSVLWNDGLRIGVGPRSAGANPGPQSYGRGGPPTLTDAALLLGLVDPTAFEPPLDVSQVSLPGEAHEFVDVARDQMAAAIQRLALSRGTDLAQDALVVLGGAAGAHAAAVAERLGIDTVLVHPCAAVLSAWGQSLARDEATAVRAIWTELDGGWPQVVEAWKDLQKALPELGEWVREVELRHRGTDFAITVQASTAAEAAQKFTESHRLRYGFDRDAAIEIVNVRVWSRSPQPSPPAAPIPPWSTDPIDGPHTLHLSTTSVHIPDGWRATPSHGLLQLTRVHRAHRAPPKTRSPHGVALWSSRFMSVAEQAGTTLQRLARSINIRERLDFSCALFDSDGNLVANAPHIPVHLGAMGATVRDLLATNPEPEPGQAWLTNDPAAGGSHLPDLTVVTAVALGGERFFTASRAHHVDVGGTTPGSMPPSSSSLEEEGFLVRQLPLLMNGRMRDVSAALVGCRDIDTVVADLGAQIAANALAARLLGELGPPAIVSRWMAHIQDVAEEAAAEAIATIPDGAIAEDCIGGVPLRLALSVVDGVLHVDLSGTGGPHAGNLNAPAAVVRATVLYGLRVLVGRPIPLNEGALRRVVIHRPPGSLVDPPPGSAIAGGNVETSQRLVDLFLRAAGRMAASAGTMSNLTIGGRNWSLYETIGAGQGASRHGPGPSGRQIHMTNTRATDPEMLERRLPLRLLRFQLRRGSGVPGPHAGGDGLVREFELLAPASAALLASRRRKAWAPGWPEISLGSDAVRIDATWHHWNGKPCVLAPGDRICIQTPGGFSWQCEKY